MNTFIILVSLGVIVAQASSQACKSTRQPPKIADTFQAQIMLHRSRPNESEFSGEGIWDYHFEMKQSVRVVKFTYNSHMEEEKHLWLFDKHMEYFVLSNGSNSNCTSRQMKNDEKLFPLWDWLKDAHCERFSDHRTKEMFDSWTTNIQNVNISLYIHESQPDVPVSLTRSDSKGEEDIRFTKFMAKTPPEAEFVVPANCN